MDHFYKMGMELHIDPNKLPQAIRLPPPQDTNKYKKAPTLEKIVTAVKGKRLPTGYYKGNIGSKKRRKSKKEENLKKRRKSKKRRKY